MSALENLNKRLRLAGGNQEGRFIKDKLETLRKAMLYSYQACTCVMPDNREFRCLINVDKLKGDYDNKMLSIPYEDICLNPDVSTREKTVEGRESTDIKTGEVITWKETDTHWLVYLQYVEEDAYFRADIRRCDVQVNVNDQKYWVYIRGPVETSMQYNQKGSIEWNDLNYSLTMYITKDENTINHFHRFATLKVPEEYTGIEKTWQVAAVNPYFGDNIIEVFLVEDFENTVKEKADAEKEAAAVKVTHSKKDIYINGETTVKAFDSVTYSIVNATGGSWYISYGTLEKALNKTTDTINFKVNMKSGTFKVIYRRDGQDDITLDVSVEAF